MLGLQLNWFEPQKNVKESARREKIDNLSSFKYSKKDASKRVLSYVGYGFIVDKAFSAGLFYPCLALNPCEME